MKISFVGKPNVVSAALKEKTEEKLQRLSKFLSEDIHITVAFKIVKIEHKIEVTFYAYGKTFRAEAKDNEDMYSALDLVVENLEKQLRRLRNKTQEKARRTSSVSDLFIEDTPEDFEEEETTIILKNQEIVPQEVEDAIMQLELLGKQFLVFRNILTDRVNVVYKTSNENTYGLIET
ncbi:MAG: ribosome-associated translation inhibitor RaiA [Defluviitaleaceae bacterium]|nr:ribosome-associated translation inhibitor RaiA [Defluviitaleaceae bacterium]